MTVALGRAGAIMAGDEPGDRRRQASDVDLRNFGVVWRHSAISITPPRYWGAARAACHSSAVSWSRL
jgi:hypothetical protein